MKKLETFAGNHIREVLVEALELAIKSKDVVTFDFNGQIYTVNPDDTYESAKKSAEKILGHQILTLDQDIADTRKRLKETADEYAAAIAKSGSLTEAQLRESDTPWPETPEELTAYIATLVDRPHDYGTCVYAMSLAATAAFHYVSKILGTTGFQASCADLDILRRTRHINGPFMLIKGEDLLYPQYDLQQKLDDFIKSSMPWLVEEARKKLQESGRTHPDVKARWEKLANGDD
jgi:hypothetical protein